MKRFSGLYEQIYDFENIHSAYLEARKNKRYRDEVLRFTANLEENLIQIQNELIWKTYRSGRYREFYVHEPKKRLIMALPFKDRVVQWAIYRVLNPLLEQRYITDSYACRNGYGAQRAVRHLQYWLRKEGRAHEKTYVLKLDISKYFYRVDHLVLMQILRRMISDDDLLVLLETIIRCEHTKFGVQLGDHQYEQERMQGLGMPIGNLTSQMFANLYLNELDHFVKEDLHVRRYMRYMDDSLILYHDKSYLWQLKSEIDSFLTDYLHLTLNNKTTVRNVNQGIDWLGYRVWSTHIKLRKASARKMRKRLRYLRRAYGRQEVTITDVNNSVQSYLGLLKHCDSYRLRKKMAEDLKPILRVPVEVPFS